MLQKIRMIGFVLAGGLSVLFSGAATAQLSEEVTALMEQVEGRIYDCDGYFSGFEYREGEGRSGWFLLNRAGPGGDWSMDEDMQIRGGGGTEVRYRSYFSDGRRGDFRLRVIDDGAYMKLLSPRFITDRCPETTRYSFSSFKSWGD